MHDKTKIFLDETETFSLCNLLPIKSLLEPGKVFLSYLIFGLISPLYDTLLYTETTNNGVK
jgi:hypothetical protein